MVRSRSPVQFWPSAQEGEILGFARLAFPVRRALLLIPLFMAPLESKALLVIGLAILFLVLVGAYYFVKFRNRNRPQTEVPKPVKTLVNTVVIVIAVIFFGGWFLLGLFELIVVSGKADLLQELAYVLIFLFVAWFVFRKKSSK
jgi:hypothetical protein